MSIAPFRAAGQVDSVPRGASREVVDAIRDASQRSGVDFKYMLAKAQTESSFDPRAKARTSSASGLYQFIESTWLKTVRDHGAKYGLGDAAAQIEDDFSGTPRVRDPAARRSILDMRFDPKTASVMAAEFAKSNLAQLLRAGGATRFLASYRNDPQRIAAAQFPEAAAANRGVFYEPQTGRARTLGQVYDFFAQKMTGEIAAVDVATAEELPAAPAMGPRKSKVELPPELQALARQFGLKGASLKPETIMAMALLAEPLVASVRGGSSLFDQGGKSSRMGAGKMFNPDIGI